MKRNRRSALWVLLILASAAAPWNALAGQEPGVVIGKVSDAITGRPIPLAVVTVTGGADSAVTSDNGSYSIIGVAPGLIKIQARVIGYISITTPYYTVLPSESTLVNFKLAPLTVELDPLFVEAEATAETWHHGATLIQPEDLPTQGSLADALQSVLPGVRSTGRRGRDQQGISIRGGASALWVVDGTVIRPPLTFYIDTKDVECVEVRSGERAALEFKQSLNSPRYSGVILVWTKGGREPKPRGCGARRPG